ncbi:MAG: DUF1573 domain-containing protein [Bacteroidales bacterium]|nr:DUF1573 domain-containing protein [Bacteroidales bacterium]
MKHKESLSILVLLFFWFGAFAQDKSTDLSNYRYNMEDNKLKLEKTYFNFGNVYSSEEKKETSAIFNDTDAPMEITFTGVTEYMVVSVNPKVIPAKSKGEITITYYASKNKDFNKNQNWGFQNARIGVIVNGNTENKRNNISVRANILEDFRNLSPEELAKAPSIEFEVMNYDFGKIKEGDKVEYEFKFYNRGERDLEIRNVKGS